MTPLRSVVIGGGEPYHLTLMARNGGFGELDNGYAHLRTIRVKFDPAADDRVDGAPLGALHCSKARIPVRYPSRQPARGA